ncbi:hypothetical protein B0H11DRAFT_1908172 [Mycena galericulata]|nr:hypothetical protein B0H11DRAFT_1908172 [Mycena galericulata]
MATAVGWAGAQAEDRTRTEDGSTCSTSRGFNRLAMAPISRPSDSRPRCSAGCTDPAGGKPTWRAQQMDPDTTRVALHNVERDLLRKDPDLPTHAPPGSGTEGIRILRMTDEVRPCRGALPPSSLCEWKSEEARMLQVDGQRGACSTGVEDEWDVHSSGGRILFCSLLITGTGAMLGTRATEVRWSPRERICNRRLIVFKGVGFVAAKLTCKSEQRRILSNASARRRAGKFRGGG